MPSDQATKAADAILDDLRGAAYYRDPEILAGFLAGRFGLPAASAAAKDAAQAIVDDFGGAAYYVKAAILATFLDSALAPAVDGETGEHGRDAETPGH